MGPIISIIIPCFNCDTTIIETLDSIYLQKLTDFEVIIVNDGSTDNSINTIENYFENKGIHNISIHTTENKGQSAARNTGARIAKGKYLLFLDADDIIHSDYLKCGVDFLEKNSSINLVYCDARLFGSINEKWKLPDFNPISLLLENSIFISAIIRKNIFLKAGEFDENLRYNEDWDLWIRIAHNFGGIYKLNNEYFFYRNSKELRSLTDLKMNFEENSMLYLFQKHYEIYKSNGLGIIDLFSITKSEKKYKRKYYGVWYRRLFYSIIKKI